jgi:crossover junction endodeoxyribonuclease RuvC
MSLFLAIDPGLVSGAWGAVTHRGEFAGCGDIPNDGFRILSKELKHILLNFIDGRDFEIVTEDVHSMPNQGISSTYKFGRAVGAIEAVARDLPGTWHIVSPQRWKRDMGLTSDKEDCRLKAISLFPDGYEYLSKKKHHNRAEALLLAEWLRRQNGA